MSSVYFLRPVGEEGPVKIGHSHWPHERLQVFASWSPIELEIAATIPGGRRLEGQFHAAFMEQHLRGEWFAASTALTATINAVQAGTFDIATLPPFAVTRAGWRPDPESIAAGVRTRRVWQLKRAGVPVPPEVEKALYTYQCDPEEKENRRAVVRDFIRAVEAA